MCKSRTRKKEKIRRRKKIDLIREKRLDQWAKEQVAIFNTPRNSFWILIARGRDGDETLFLAPEEPDECFKYEVHLPSMMVFDKACDWFEENEKDVLTKMEEYFSKNNLIAKYLESWQSGLMRQS